MNSFLLSLRQKKVILIASLLLLIGLAALIYWLWLAVWLTHNVGQKPDWEKKILSAPKVPTEAAIVLSYTGPIQRLDLRAGQLAILTSAGVKTVTFSPSTPIKVIAQQPLPDRPPSGQAPAKTVAELTSPATVESLKVGNLIQVASLTNISGLATFKADTIVVLQ